jgi:large subunit ribosomal protein L10
MNRAQKSEVVEALKGNFSQAPFIVLTDWVGSTVEELDKLRRSCEPVGSTFRVVKNTLCRRALEGTEMQALSDVLAGNIGVLFSGEDPIASAKAFKAQAKENPKLEVRAGFFEGDILGAEATLAVAELPSREELQVTLLRTLQEGPRQVLGVIQGPARDLLCVLNNHAANL